MRTTTAIATAAILLAVAGCTSNSTPEPDPAVTTATATADPAAATISQWASLIAPLDREWRDRVDEVDDDCANIDNLFPCNAGYLVLSLQAQRYVVVIDGAQDPAGTDRYLGDPPAEIAPLVEQTSDAASAVEPAQAAYSAAGCTDPLDPDCAVESMAMRRAVGDMTSAFDAWAPYM